MCPDFSTYAGYRLLSRALVAMGVWVTPEGKSTTWAPGWNVERFEREAEILPLPSELLTVVLPIVRVVARTPAAPRAPQFRAGLSRPKQTPRPGLSKVGAVVVSNA